MKKDIIAIYINDKYIDNLNFSLENLKGFECLIVDCTSNNLALLSESFLEKKFQVLSLPGFSFDMVLKYFEENRETPIKIILKAGETISEFVSENSLCQITYLDVFFPFVSVFEKRTLLEIKNDNFNKINSINNISDEKIDFNSNIENLNILLTKNPDINLLFNLGILLLLNKEYEQAKKIFKYLISIRQNKWDEVYYGLSLKFCGNNDGEKILKKYSNKLVFSNIWLNQPIFTDSFFPIESFEEKILFEQQKKYITVQKKINFIKPKIKITAMLAIKNEEKYIGKVLSDLSEYVDSITILDDASTDNTRQIVKEFSKVKKLIVNDSSLPRHEGRDRNRLFKLAKGIETDWFICMDGDEIFEDKMKENIQKLCSVKNIDGYFFRIFHMWNGYEFFRYDGIWKNQLRLKLFRNLENYDLFENKKLHVQTKPINLPIEMTSFSELRIKHFGYSDYDDTLRKYHFYEKEDTIKNPEEIGRNDYKHLIDESELKLVKWEENISSRNSFILCYEKSNQEPTISNHIYYSNNFFKKIILLDQERKNKQINNILKENKSEWILILKDNEYLSPESLENLKKEVIFNCENIFSFFVNGNQEIRMIRNIENICFNSDDKLIFDITNPVYNSSSVICN